MIAVIGQWPNADIFQASSRVHTLHTRAHVLHTRAHVGIVVVVGIRTESSRLILCDLIHIGKQTFPAHVEEHVLADTSVKTE